GVVSANRRFISACTGFSSKMHDSNVFSHSPLSNEIARICEDGRYHLLGDSAYPNRVYLITPFRNRDSLDPVRSRFNRKLSSTRVRVENAFGILKSRFRQLTRLRFWRIE